jgi:hypothetical protein
MEPWNCISFGTTASFDHHTNLERSEFAKMHLTKKAKIKCPLCVRTFSADELSAQFLRQDLFGFTFADGEWYVESLTTAK